MGTHLKGCVSLDTNDLTDCWCEAKRYWIALTVGMVLLAGEVVGGFVSGSLALLSDAVHVCSDNVHVAVAIIVVYASRRSAGKEESIRKAGAYVGLLLLLIGGVWIINEAYERFTAPREVAGGIMLVVAIIGAIGNGYVLWVLESVSKGDQTITHKFFSAHVLSDLVVSIAVIVSAGIIAISGWKIVDPIASLCAGIYLLAYLCPSLYKEISGDDADKHHHH
ncbi:MAG: hypothetical protein COZ49_01010 [Candidatus Yonathbacteria bacterium CG_4_10_14_3_um_filter_47_65]|uniref:Cation efflux protein transmembrane domain-containing protein n=2 Tax=Parcubacteria group TaxID=1794811 RepID=A0A2M8D665_9BACT|nr:MAG: hypothetical protein AUJ44_02590 [Candidatus Nomurabacteria bacterium CG1_02_47_685]PIP03388.1 MAG: hypothetical protein COX54_03800 [Candidatus Yonathbacteria bacterium CG23_combo_of_CG06-09_8_20_14_all_46_18]PIQ32897.1 MAG: hypothetical protein COW61_00795 [Candidatus Yonathbacteria bacterium CG17_big_fil_post_rev_8_21_14_2_50_46_19]PIX56629.1 MAG: hypothetical protein COZ49_01010 [Candidatus Yonathbacteria bacterium CG_4_10_14_3_um_filter_47_65]PIY57481.1 MAG: hypothetical protein CO